MAENFTVILKQANLATSDFAEKTGFHDKLKTLNKKVTSSKTKKVEVKKKLTDLTKMLHKYQKKNMIFC